MDESTIYKKLYDFFKPEILKVINDSENTKDIQEVQTLETRIFQ